MNTINEKINDIEFLEPGVLSYEEVSLKLLETVSANHSKGFVPIYKFGIYIDNSPVKIGHLSFKVGNNEHIILYVGHIGFQVDEKFRGRYYAYKACLALRKFILNYYNEIIITCNPDNISSVKTIEKLGAEFIECLEIPYGNLLSTERNETHKNRYIWNLTEKKY